MEAGQLAIKTMPIEVGYVHAQDCRLGLLSV
jgi:hypothetical protein